MEPYYFGLLTKYANKDKSIRTLVSKMCHLLSAFVEKHTIIKSPIPMK